MISLTTFEYDPNGWVQLNTRLRNPYSARRRGAVTATLDGGVSVYDTGYAEADQTFTVRVLSPSKAVLVQLRYLVAYYGQLRLACEMGVYRVILQTALDGKTLTLTLRVIARLDA